MRRVTKGDCVLTFLKAYTWKYEQIIIYTERSKCSYFFYLILSHFCKDYKYLVLIMRIYFYYKARYTLFANTTSRANKILFAKTGRMCYYTPLVVRRQFSLRTYSPLGISFFRRKTPLCLSKRPLPWRKSCEQHRGEKLVCKTWRTHTIHYSLYVGFSSFRSCFVVVRK